MKARDKVDNKCMQHVESPRDTVEVRLDVFVSPTVHTHLLKHTHTYHKLTVKPPTARNASSHQLYIRALICATLTHASTTREQHEACMHSSCKDGATHRPLHNSTSLRRHNLLG